MYSGTDACVCMFFRFHLPAFFFLKKKISRRFFREQEIYNMTKRNCCCTPFFLYDRQDPMAFATTFLTSFCNLRLCLCLLSPPPPPPTFYRRPLPIVFSFLFSVVGSIYDIKRSHTIFFSFRYISIQRTIVRTIF